MRTARPSHLAPVPPAARPVGVLEPTDLELLRSSAAGSRRAWTDLVERHVADVWCWAVDRGASSGEAELVSELVWLRLSQAPNALSGPLAVWLREAVDDEADRLRRRAGVLPERRGRHVLRGVPAAASPDRRA